MNFDWGSASPALQVPPDRFSVRWSGRIQPRYSEVYTFPLTGNDGCRLWINDQLLINKWRPDEGSDVTGSILLTAGQRYKIRVEYFDDAGSAWLKLEWQSASQAREVVPQGVLFANYPPLLVSPALVNNQFEVTVMGPAGADYYVYARSNLSDRPGHWFWPPTHPRFPSVSANRPGTPSAITASNSAFETSASPPRAIVTSGAASTTAENPSS